MCKNIFRKCGKSVNVERRANFGAGTEIEIGDNSGLGVNCMVPNGTIIGTCCVLTKNYDEFSIIGGVPGKVLKTRK